MASTAELLSRDPALTDVRVTVAGSSPPVMADPDLLKIVFVNLLVNGAQAMHGRGAIDVTISASPQACQITVADGGPGIPAAIREKIFTPFFTTKSRGTGLGLPTVKRIVDAHAGRITLDCPAGGGTTVSIQLPN
jgi:signal transduction histidine kinase